ncbi:DNA-binding transcriptional regulator, XRE-family HTH domain [Monaibacterium marinum]|uniref:DNA-binding transcriptional regulator, XRE-family HTH domain n=1 Tax=Pontivivens marinum TaxID=1690039 RepID=A0A2C9CQH7_9RHOB|nr:helix-turn-helix transcriptional regulator [Monaibacterium marinum]SOH93457.1 DNA-binding transcriptional regulator, XRE-family HTH domain [Monaibacterium marinum]
MSEAGCTLDALTNDQVGERIRWHRGIEGLTQSEYASEIGAKRAVLSLWENGASRLSLDGAVAIKKRWGLSLDFLYFSEDHSLPLSLHRLWRSNVAKGSAIHE